MLSSFFVAAVAFISVPLSSGKSLKFINDAHSSVD